MREPASGLPFVALVVLGGCATSPRLDGPLPVRNQHPAQLLVLHMPPAAAAVLPAGETTLRADAAYSSLFLTGGSGGRTYLMDGEYLRVGTRLRVGLGKDLEADVEVPFAHTAGGFLDGFLVGYHDLLGMPDQNRSNYPRDEFAIEARRDGETVWSVDRREVALLDIPLGLTWQLRDPAPDGFGVAVRGAIELPTGDEHAGYGNGQLDGSAGILLEEHAFGGAFYGHLQHTLAGTPGPSRRAGFSFADVTSTGLSWEQPCTDDLNALLQIEFETSTLRELDLPEASRHQLLLWFGARWMAGERWAVEVGFGEDLQGFVSPDFTAWVGFTTVAPKTRRRKP